jgi:hypothetical protein
MTGCRCSEPDPVPTMDVVVVEASVPDAAKEAGRELMMDWEDVYGSHIKKAVGEWGDDEQWIRVTARADSKDWKLPYPYLIETSGGVNCGIFEKSTNYEHKPGYCLRDGKRIVFRVYVSGRYYKGVEKGKPRELASLKVKVGDGGWITAEGKRK